MGYFTEKKNKFTITKDAVLKVYNKKNLKNVWSGNLKNMNALHCSKKNPIVLMSIHKTRFGKIKIDKVFISINIDIELIDYLIQIMKKCCNFIDLPYSKAASYSVEKAKIKESFETKCNCLACEKEWYVSKSIKQKAVGNAMLAIGNTLSGNSALGAFHLNNTGNIYACPECKSERVKKEEIPYYNDKYDNILV